MVKARDRLHVVEDVKVRGGHVAGDEEGPVVVAVAGVPQEREVGAVEVKGAADDAGAGRESS